MIFVFQNLRDTYNYYVYSLKDPRTSEWFLVKSPLQIFLLLALYVHICLLAGPKFMKKRQLYELKSVVRFYNAIQILLNLHLFKEIVGVMYLLNFNFQCEEIDYSTSPLTMRIIEATWLYLIIKIIDLCNCVFPVFQKKVNEKSSSQVYYHSLMVFVSFLIIRFGAGGNNILVIVLDSFVHIAIHFCYLISSLEQDYHEYFWWKIYLIELQLVQHFVIFLHNFQVLFRDCAFPHSITALNIVNSIYSIYVFGKFYKPKLTKTSNRNETHL